MSTKEEVLKKLIDSNDYVSGEMLAKEIGVSRASVWKAIKTLQKAGYDIEGVTHYEFSEFFEEAIEDCLRLPSSASRWATHCQAFD